jgi:hypothetical protein
MLTVSESHPKGNIGEACCRLIVFPAPFQHVIVVHLSGVSLEALPQLIEIFAVSRDKTHTHTHTKKKKKKKKGKGKQELKLAGLNQTELFHSLLSMSQECSTSVRGSLETRDL